MKLFRIYIFHNPVAGTSNPTQVKEVLTSVLREKGIDYTYHQTRPDENIKALTQQAVAQGYDSIWAVGGDGTVSEVANGLIGSHQAALGIIPTGSGNALARELGIPLTVESACQTLLDDSHKRLLDAMQVRDTHYLLTVSVGVGAQTMAETDRSQKRKLGRLAYILNGLRLLLSRAIWPFRVEIDGQKYRIRATEIITANAGILGYRALRWGKDIKMDDGQLNLCYVRANSVRNMLNALRGAALGQQDQVLELNCLPAREEVLITHPEDLPVQGDGEEIGTTPVRIKLAAGVISILAPPHPA